MLSGKKSMLLRLQKARKAFAIHLLVSLLVACIAAWMVFFLWFPSPYQGLAGGSHLFWMLVGIDIICGPLLTLILFHSSKSRRELTLDLSLVVIIQLAALIYGLHSIALARPVVIAFEVDRFVAVSLAQLDPTSLAQAPIDMRSMSWTGPRLIGTRRPLNEVEGFRSLELSLQGIEPSARPDWWQAYEQSAPDVRQRMKPIADLRAKCTAETRESIDAAVAKTGMTSNTLYYLPLTSQKMVDGWIILLDVQAKIVGYAPVDGF